jgi:Fe2+ transport system protein FeoA
MGLHQAIILKEYQITEINFEADLEMGTRLLHLGFLPGEKIKVIRKTPFTSDSLLIEVRGTKMAMTKQEAKLVNIIEI